MAEEPRSGARREGPAAPEESLEELRARYDELQRRVTRFSVVEQQLIRARDRRGRGRLYSG